MDGEFDRWEEMYIISDLHLGGESGFQMCRTGTLLGKTIDHIAGRATDHSVALILNGDVVDFLAEIDAVPFDPIGAASRLGRIAGRAEFAPVFKALAGLLTKKQGRLVVVLGNHDVELALPAVQRRFLDLLTSDPARRARVEFVTDGTGYRAQVGRRSVYCFHGEIADDNNRVDHQAVREVVQHLKRGTVPPAWTPNFGTNIVIDIMNGVKARHPFVDLLKPAMEMAVPLLLDVDPSLVNDTSRLERLAGTAIVALTPPRERDRFLGGAGPAAEHSVGPSNPGLTPNDLAFLDDWAGRRPIDAVDEDGSLGLSDAAASLRSLLARVVPTDSSLIRRYTRWQSRKDRTFDLGSPDKPVLWAETNHLSCDIVVAGHTHLRRRIQRPGFQYFNSGTWASLMKVEPAELDDPARYDALVEELRSDPTARRADEPTVVRIIAIGNDVAASLCQPVLTDGVVALTEIPAEA